MAGVNKVIIVGNLGNDPETKQIGSGNTVSKFSVATSDNWVDKQGQKQERTEWHRIVVWGKLAELCGEYLSKGRQVYVEGRLQTTQWEDKDGNKRYTTEVIATQVVFLSARSAGGTSRDSFESPEPSFGSNSGMHAPMTDDDVPF